MTKTKTFATLLLGATMLTSEAYAQTTPQDKINAGAATVTDTKKLDKDMAGVLSALGTLGGKPIETLSATDARMQPTPTDAVKVVLTQQGKPTSDPMQVATKEITVAGGAGQIPARVYTPTDAKPGEALPVIVYYHGGGFVIATNDTYDASARAISHGAKAIVVSVEYRKAPEAKFPAQQDDAFAAYKWVLANAGSFGGDVKKIAVMGESAGGNLAMNTAIAARDAKIQMPLYEVLVYPMAGTNMTTPSYIDSANAKPLNKAMMGWFYQQSTNGASDLQDPRLNIYGSADLHGLPPTDIILAEVDPLRSDGQLLADKLDKAGVKVKTKTYDGVTHEFFGMGAVVGDAKDAEGRAASDFKGAF